jgi:hypothetical protein
MVTKPTSSIIKDVYKPIRVYDMMCWNRIRSPAVVSSTNASGSRAPSIGGSPPQLQSLHNQYERGAAGLPTTPRAAYRSSSPSNGPTGSSSSPSSPPTWNGRARSSSIDGSGTSIATLVQSPSSHFSHMQRRTSFDHLLSSPHGAIPRAINTKERIFSQPSTQPYDRPATPDVRSSSRMYTAHSHCHEHQK